MNNVKNALTRKLGPLPVWAWALVAGVLLYYYRNRSGAVGTQSGTGTGSVAPGPGLQPLLPDQSYYDPATPGQFFTTPPDTTNTSGQNGRHRSSAHILKPHRHKRKKGEKPRRGIKLPGRRAKGGTAHKTHVSRTRPDREPDRKRDRKKTRVHHPVKARPTGGAAIAPAHETRAVATPKRAASRTVKRPTRRAPARKH